MANAIATGGALVALILAFGPRSGAHMNPAVTLAAALTGGLRWHTVPAYILAQIAGAIIGGIFSSKTDPAATLCASWQGVQCAKVSHLDTRLCETLHF